MERLKLKSDLDILSNIAVLIVAAIVITSFALNYYRGSVLLTQLQPGLKKEAILPRLAGIDYTQTSQTLLIVLNTQCQYCIASLPLYDRIAKSQRDKNRSVQIFAVFPNSLSEVRQYVAQNQLVLPIIAGVDLNELSLAGTPTIILLNREGRIVDFWIGKLSVDSEEDVIRQITSS